MAHVIERLCSSLRSGILTSAADRRRDACGAAARMVLAAIACIMTTASLARPTHIGLAPFAGANMTPNRVERFT
jgi:hypothetical protein